MSADAPSALDSSIRLLSEARAERDALRAKLERVEQVIGVMREAEQEGHGNTIVERNATYVWRTRLEQAMRAAQDPPAQSREPLMKRLAFGVYQREDDE